MKHPEARSFQRPAKAGPAATFRESLCRESGRQEGSAYIVTLMVLFVLTALGLSLTLITSTESTIGSQERTIQRTFFAADSGLHLALAATMSRNDCSARCVNIEDDSEDLFNSNGLVDQIELTKMAALADHPSSLTQVNDTDFRNIQHWVASRATRVIPDNPDPIPVGQRTVAQMFSLDPWVAPLTCYTDVFVPCSTSSTLTTIPPP